MKREQLKQDSEKLKMKMSLKLKLMMLNEKQKIAQTRNNAFGN